MYLWCQQNNIQKTMLDTNLSEKTVIDVYSFFREICAQYLVREPIRLGGHGIVVQIDESCFSHKVKHHRGRGPQETVWVFGLVDLSNKPARGYMEVVENRAAATLLPIIQRVCRPGTIINSDEWPAYRRIQQTTGFAHNTVNHSVHFVDPVTGIHTQNIESYWAKHKLVLKKMKGCRREFLTEYLQEFMWRDKFEAGQSTFEALCGHIALIHRV